MSQDTQSSITPVTGIVQAAATIVALVGLYISHRQAKETRQQTEAQIRQLSEETRQNRNAMEENRAVAQMSQYQGALQLMFDWRSELIANPKLAEEFRKEPYFAEAFAVLDPEKYFHTVKLFHIFEHFWLLYDREIIQHDMWEPWSNNVILLMRQSKNRALWNVLKKIGIFNRSFVAMVDAKLGGADTIGTAGGSTSAA